MGTATTVLPSRVAKKSYFFVKKSAEMILKFVSHTQTKMVNLKFSKDISHPMMYIIKLVSVSQLQLFQIKKSLKKSILQCFFTKLVKAHLAMKLISILNHQ